VASQRQAGWKQGGSFHKQFDWNVVIGTGFNIPPVPVARSRTFMISVVVILLTKSRAASSENRGWLSEWAYLDTVPGRDGALRRPRRRAKRQATEPSVTDWAPRGIRSALADSGGDIAARCPYQNQEQCQDAPDSLSSRHRRDCNRTGARRLRRFKVRLSNCGRCTEAYRGIEAA
jgi:hypothetical protein